jgi:hypothetical protein
VDGDYKVIRVIAVDSKQAPGPVLTYRVVRKWVPGQAPFTFRIGKGLNRVAAVLPL